MNFRNCALMLLSFNCGRSAHFRTAATGRLSILLRMAFAEEREGDFF